MECGIWILVTSLLLMGFLLSTIHSSGKPFAILYIRVWLLLNQFGLQGCGISSETLLLSLFTAAVEVGLCSMHGRGHFVQGGHQDDFPGVPFVTTVWCFTVRTCGRLSVLG